ncbi:MAG: hypothetical protein U9R42_06665 [Bacteroidota bacterium]|nr:hypothetical protein [Bacteroidota bacterium]
MSYVFGWKTESSVFISCDTALTSSKKEGNLRFSKTSFGENHIFNEDMRITEEMLKIFQLSNNILIGFAGDNDVAFDTVNNIKILLQFRESNIDSLIEIIKQSTENCVPEDNDSSIGLIVGFSDSNNSYLLSYNFDGTRRILVHDDTVQIGSISNEFKILTKKFIEAFVNHPLPDSELLITINSIVQSYGIHDYLIKQGVGGIITGAMLNVHGILWQRDTTHLLYNSIDLSKKVVNNTAPPPKVVNIDNLSPQVVNIIMRDGAIVSQDMYEQKRIYGNIFNTPDFDLWYKRHLNNNPEIFNNKKPKYFVFYMIDSWNITILCGTNKIKNSKYFNVSNWGGGEFYITISQLLMDKLLKKKQKSKDVFKSLTINRILDEEQ